MRLKWVGTMNELVTRWRSIERSASAASKCGITTTVRADQQMDLPIARRTGVVERAGDEVHVVGSEAPQRARCRAGWRARWPDRRARSMPFGRPVVPEV